MIDVNRAPGSTERNFVFTFGATEYNTVNKMIIIIRGKTILTKSNTHSTCLSNPKGPNKNLLITGPNVMSTMATTNTIPNTSVYNTLRI